MLTLESLKSTSDIVAMLADRNVTLRPVAQSPLAEAMAATSIWGEGLECLSEIDGMALNLSQANGADSGPVAGEASFHSQYQDAAAAALGNTLATQVSFATTVVLPAMFELHNHLKDVLNVEKQFTARSWNVRMAPTVGLLDVPGIVSEVEKHAENAMRDVAMNLDFASVTDEQLVGLLKVGADTHDAAVDEFIANTGIAIIREAYEYVFTYTSDNLKSYDAFRADRRHGTARNITTFLIASKLLQNGDDDTSPQPSGVTGLSNNRRITTLKNLQEVSGLALCAVLEYKQREERHGKLVEKIEGRVIYANKNVYERYMADGGDVEVILGAVISGKNNLYVEDLEGQADNFKHVWTLFAASSKSQMETGQLTDVRRAIVHYVQAYVRDCDDAIVKANAERVVSNASDFVASLYLGDLKDLDMLALRVICQCVYNHTNALDLLRGVNDAMSINPDISKEDALNLSVVAYVADWFASQITCA